MAVKSIVILFWLIECIHSTWPWWFEAKGIVGNKSAEETGHEGLRLAMPAHSDLCTLCGLLRQSINHIYSIIITVKFFIIMLNYVIMHINWDESKLFSFADRIKLFSTVYIPNQVWPSKPSSIFWGVKASIWFLI